jgi:hypothetical protein
MRAGLIEAFPASHIAVKALLSGATGTGVSESKCWMAGDFIPRVAVAATRLPQLLQKAVPSSNLVPHFVQKAIKILLTVYGCGRF